MGTTPTALSNDHHCLLEINGLRISFRTEDGWNEVVHGVDLCLQPGKTLAIVGESGSGKSVSSLAIVDLHPASRTRTEGRLLWSDPSAGEEQLKAGSVELHAWRGRRVGIIFQEPMTALNPVMTCGAQVAEVLVQHMGMDKDAARTRTIELFREVRLPRPEAHYHEYPHQLSGGQRQRVMIAMAIACEPRLIIADEPTTALDVTVQKGVLELLRELQRKHSTALLFITHDLGIVAELADEVIVMQHGIVVERGTASEVLNNPTADYTRGLLACRPAPQHKGFTLPTIGEPGSRPTPAIAVAGEEEILRVHEIGKTYHAGTSLFGRGAKEVRAVDAVSFSLFPGETLGLVGESGCGKSTLSRMLLGLIQPSSGEVFFRGERIAAGDAGRWARLRKDIQIVFQDPYSSLNPRLTVGDAIMEPMVVHGMHSNASLRRKEVGRLLEQVGLPSTAAHRYPHEFSGGQRQRIVIARALAVEPKVLICDESVAALDVSVQAQILNLLNQLKAEFGLSYLFISHDLNVVYYMCDRIMVMQQGRIIESGPADRVVFQPQEEYTRRLIDAVPGGLKKEMPR